ncbi:uncharacterized protein LOC118363101 [Oncorhynchus keta]|uniref:uncharacterized protein LOC118363101 n=1 Tax=Oncorhynchus keta TaxID=8018 RepID=UPI0015F8802D|nr:uncharacterized protein LOC118363101 [Oncorhynchus keta]XP_035599706.1 uncharacterized protein LOC118363101 [Oncorhynchus keta]XP_052344236.1 uncharacterized protein LOC118363101 [Oncorhynchus keta]
MVQHIVRIHGLPMDMVSDQGPQFSSSSGRRSTPSFGPTASLRETTRTSRPPCAAWSLPIPPPGANSLCGSNMPATPFPALPQDYLPSNVLWGIGPCSSLSRKRRCPDVCLPLSSYLEESPVGPPQDQLQESTASGSPSDPGSPVSSQAEGVTLPPGSAPPGEVSQTVPPVSPSPRPTPPPRVADGHPAYTARCLLMVRPRGRAFQYLVD